MHILILAIKSILNRKFTIALTIFSIALSIMLLLGVERLRNDARESFANTISGTDLIVGARSGPVQLMLYAVFRIGDPTNNVSWESYQDIKNQRLVDWTIPISLGDSHRGFRVLGTNPDYFNHYQYGGGRTLALAEGSRFDDVYDAVLGADVADQEPGGHRHDRGRDMERDGELVTAEGEPEGDEHFERVIVDPPHHPESEPAEDETEHRAADRLLEEQLRRGGEPAGPMCLGFRAMPADRREGEADEDQVDHVADPVVEQAFTRDLGLEAFLQVGFA